VGRHKSRPAGDNELSFPVELDEPKATRANAIGFQKGQSSGTVDGIKRLPQVKEDLEERYLSPYCELLCQFGFNNGGTGAPSGDGPMKGVVELDFGNYAPIDYLCNDFPKEFNKTYAPVPTACLGEENDCGPVSFGWEFTPDER
jgi:hypothetical protein